MRSFGAHRADNAYKPFIMIHYWSGGVGIIIMSVAKRDTYDAIDNKVCKSRKQRTAMFNLRKSMPVLPMTRM
jgi:hypothetical protein